MKIHFEDLQYTTFIDELQKQKQKYMARPDQIAKHQIETDILFKEGETILAIQRLNAEDEAYFVDEFQEYRSDKMMDYYHEISSYFQKAFAIFEVQISKSGCRIDFSKYPKINEVNQMVNVLKHGEGRSLERLKALNSKFLAEPVEFPNIWQEMYSTKVFNLEMTDLFEFFDEAILVWKDKINQNKINREAAAADDESQK